MSGKTQLRLVIGLGVLVVMHLIYSAYRDYEYAISYRNYQIMDLETKLDYLRDIIKNEQNVLITSNFVLEDSDVDKAVEHCIKVYGEERWEEMSDYYRGDAIETYWKERQEDLSSWKNFSTILDGYLKEYREEEYLEFIGELNYHECDEDCIAELYEL